MILQDEGRFLRPFHILKGPFYTEFRQFLIGRNARLVPSQHLIVGPLRDVQLIGIDRYILSGPSDDDAKNLRAAYPRFWKTPPGD